MIPHGRKDSKFDSKSKLYQLNELAELYNCNNVMFFEARKGQDLYLHMSKVPNGPTVKFHVQNRKLELAPSPAHACFPDLMLTRALSVHTMEELHFAGNCLKGSRPILSFDASFDNDPYLQVIRELFLHMFGVPQGARKSKPFIDHVMGFTYLDGKVWVRNYQINEVEATQKEGEEVDAEAEAEKAKQKKSKAGSRDTDVSLVEIGPRFVLTPIVIQEGSFGGPLIYENKQFVSPNQIRADLRRQKMSKHSDRAEQVGERVAKRRDLGLRADGVPKPRDELDTKMLFA